MGTYARFKNSETHEKGGVWLDLGEAGMFKIARAGGSNKTFEREFTKAMRPHRRKIETETANSEELQKVLVTLFAKTIILDWKGVTGPDGEELPFSVENCIQVMLDLPDLFKEIHATATAQDVFRAEIFEEDAKN